MTQETIAPIKVYTGDNCVRCTQTMRMFEQAGVVYEPIDVRNTPEALEHMQSLGYTSLPVVIVSEPEPKHWSGFDMMKIRALIRGMAPSAAQLN